MLGKLLKVLETGKGSRKSAPAVATPDISRVLKSSAAAAPAPEAAPPEEVPAEAPAPVFEANPHELVTEAEAAVDALSNEFDGWMRNDLEALREAWRAAQAPEAGADEYRTLYTCAHNIRGAATSYGYPAVSRLSGSLCTLLGATCPGENSALINLHIEACRAAVAAGPQGESSESVADAVCEALERKVVEKAAAAG